MRQRVGSMWAPHQGSVPARADRMVDGSVRHRPRSRHGLSAEQESVLELQRLAGNAAVTRALADGRGSGRVTSVDAIELTREGMGADRGLANIRDKAHGASVLALTRRSIEDAPPLMRPEPASKGPGGYTTRAIKVGSIPEPKIEEWWPTAGRHKTGEATYLDVNGDWEHKLEKGEDEHASDAKLSWELTWKKVQDTINKFADKPGPPEATPDVAKDALWKRYVAALPKDLQPEGNTPSDSKQREVLAVRPGTFFAWMWEITVARDGRMYHETRSAPSTSATSAPKNAVVNTIIPAPQFLVPGPTSEELIKEIRAKYTPGRIIQGSKLKEGGAPGNAG